MPGQNGRQLSVFQHAPLRSPKKLMAGAKMGAGPASRQNERPPPAARPAAKLTWTAVHAMAMTMSFSDFCAAQRDGMRAMAGAGVIGLHLVSGPMVGFALGYGLDLWLGIGPWGGAIGLIIGILAGFLNVYRDTRQLLASSGAREGDVQDGPGHGR